MVKGFYPNHIMSNQYTSQWTPTDIEFLKEHYHTWNAKTLSATMGRSVNSIFVKASILKLHKETSNVSALHFVEIVSPEVAYILGYLWADGSIRNRAKSVRLKINEEDYQNIKPTLLFIGKWSESQIKPKLPFHSAKIEARFNNKVIYDFLVKNVYYQKSVASPTEILSRIPSHLHSHFFRGFFDGDGCIQRYTVSITGSYNQNWTDVCRLLKILGTNFKIVKQINKKRKSRCSRIEMYGKENILKFLAYIYRSRDEDKIGLDRKFEKYIEYFKSV